MKDAEHKVDDLKVGEASTFLLGTWEREETVGISRLKCIDISYKQRISLQHSKINISIQTLSSGSKIFDCKAVNEGKWHPEKEAGRTEHYETFKENIDFITAGNGVWVQEGKGVS